MYNDLLLKHHQQCFQQQTNEVNSNLASGEMDFNSNHKPSC